jgi:hypothetical protein
MENIEKSIAKIYNMQFMFERHGSGNNALSILSETHYNVEGSSNYIRQVFIGVIKKLVENDNIRILKYNMDEDDEIFTENNMEFWKVSSTQIENYIDRTMPEITEYLESENIILYFYSGEGLGFKVAWPTSDGSWVFY